MSESLCVLALLAFPMGIGLIVWMMMRGDHHRFTAAEEPDQPAERARQLRGQLNELRVLRDHGSAEGNRDRRVVGHSSL